MEDYQKDQQLQNHPQNKLLPPTQKNLLLRKREMLISPQLRLQRRKKRKPKKLKKRMLVIWVQLLLHGLDLGHLHKLLLEMLLLWQLQDQDLIHH
jgi:hypothetical protein